VERAAFAPEPAAARSATTGGGVAAVERADVAGRAERVLALQDAAATQPLSQVTLVLDGEDGADARIRVGLRGSMVGASIDTTDPIAAASLRNHVAELRHALERRGLDASALLVRAAPRAAEPADLARLFAPLGSTDTGAGTVSTAASRESSAQRDTGQHGHPGPRRDADAQRQRQQRQNKEDRP
ncbi:MAG: hypothetical protein ACRELX_13095, partial [Longimicrobiales bacterium]